MAALENLKFINSYICLIIIDALYKNDLDLLPVFASMTTSLPHSQLKYSGFLSFLIILSVYQTQASSLSMLITFVNTFHFNLVVMFVCFTCVSLVINLIYSKQLVLLIWRRQIFSKLDLGLRFYHF
jgi:hypothetical protein